MTFPLQSHFRIRSWFLVCGLALAVPALTATELPKSINTLYPASKSANPDPKRPLSLGHTRDSELATRISALKQ